MPVGSRGDKIVAPDAARGRYLSRILKMMRTREGMKKEHTPDLIYVEFGAVV